MRNGYKIGENTIEKYKHIIDEWFVNKFDGGAAYRKFYPNIKNLQTATVNFSKIQALPEMRSYISEKHAIASQIVQATHEGILKELQNCLEADITQTITLNADQIKELPIEFRRLITRYKNKVKHYYDKDGNLLNIENTIELHLFSKEKAAEMLNKHIGFYEADNKQKTTEIKIQASTEKHSELIEKIIKGDLV